MAHRRSPLGRLRTGRRRGPAPEVAGRGVIPVDDGPVTGVTARAALRHLRRRGPGRLILAEPVCGPGRAEALRDGGPAP
jgi:putative phosphoribosyl transferase